MRYASSRASKAVIPSVRTAGDCRGSGDDAVIRAVILSREDGEGPPAESTSSAPNGGVLHRASPVQDDSGAPCSHLAPRPRRSLATLGMTWVTLALLTL